ncbi:hypothetical protein D3C85_1859700 [compost metagenome]
MYHCRLLRELRLKFDTKEMGLAAQQGNYIIQNVAYILLLEMDSLRLGQNQKFTHNHINPFQF